MKLEKMYKILLWILLGLWLAIAFPTTAQIPANLPVLEVQETVSSQSPQYWIERSENAYQSGNLLATREFLRKAIAIFQQETEQEQNLAITLTNLGRIELELGQGREAWKIWDEAEKYYPYLTSDRREEFKERLPIYRASALQKMGQYPRACQKLTDTLGLETNICLSKEQFLETIERKLATDSETELEIYRDIMQQDSEIFWKTYLKIELEKYREIIQQTPNSFYVTGWRSLGEVLRILGKLEESQQVLEHLEAIVPASSPKAKIILSLGNTLRAKGNLERDRKAPPKYNYMPWRCEIVDLGDLEVPEKAQDWYQEAMIKYRDAIAEIGNSVNAIALKNKLNLLTLLLETARVTKDRSQLLEAHSILHNLLENSSKNQQFFLSQFPLSRTKIYAEIQLAKSQSCLYGLSPELSDRSVIDRFLQIALNDAKILDDDITRAYVLGNWGSWYEYLAWREKFSHLAAKTNIKIESKNRINYLQEARQLTEKALFLAQPRQYPHIAYQWEWQLGRLLHEQGNIENAIASYQAATKTLDSVREDLLVINSDVQFNFRDYVEPVYRETVDLLFENAANFPNSSQEQDSLKKARNFIQSLQLAELANFLKCQISAQQDVTIDDIVEIQDSQEAVIHIILLNNKVNLVLKLPNEDLKFYSSQTDRDKLDGTKTLEQTVKDLTTNLPEPNAENDVKKDAQRIYQWLIEPLRSQLEFDRIKTLVFLLDSRLQNIPMGVLYDGEQYLIENYAIAITSGLQLQDPELSEQQRLNALLGGMTEFEEYRNIANIERQFAKIKAKIPSEILLDENFTIAALKAKLERLSIPVLHLATHGQFSSDPEETFIVTADGKMNADRLGNIIQNSNAIASQPVELLSLVACETATGDKRATLGLAGLAFKAGAKSALATLWKVITNDSPGDLMSRFYELLQDSTMSKAEALQKAQLEFLQSRNRRTPNIWAPYILIGNWH